MKLKEEMGVENILKREKEQLKLIWEQLAEVPGLHILASEHKERLGVISFYIDGLHYLAGVKMLNDKFGIQTRGGCSCAGTYGHYLLNVTPDMSKEIIAQVMNGNCSVKPGWIRMSIHPTTTNEEIAYITSSIKTLANRHKEWLADYDFDRSHNVIRSKNPADYTAVMERVDRFF